MSVAKKIKYDYPTEFNPKKLGEDNIDRLSMGMVPDKAKLLELGCATGFMSQYLTENKNCQVYGVEINKLAAKKAQKYCRKVINGSLDDLQTWKKIRNLGKFDCVLASAILEHLKEPEEALKRIKSVLRSKGTLVITLPNITHWRQRLDRIRGSWDYEDYGILDKTHLRFFNYFTAQKLVKNAGFKIIEVAIDPAGGIKYLNWLFKNYPNLYAHQIAIKAQKN